jgi:CRP-like cAMP-binding protein
MSDPQETRFWERIPTTERADILKSARRLVFAKDEEIFHQGDVGDGVYLIETGEVRISVDDPDHDIRDLSWTRTARSTCFIGSQSRTTR